MALPEAATVAAFGEPVWHGTTATGGPGGYGVVFELTP